MRNTIGLFPVLICLIALGCGSAAAPVAAPAPVGPPLTEAEVQTLADQMSTFLQVANEAAINGLVDFDSLMLRAIAGIPMQPKAKESFLAGARKSKTIGKQFCQIVNSGGKIDLLRVHQQNGEWRALFRTLNSDGAIGYQDFIAERMPRGVCFVDLYAFANGEKMSETAGRMAVVAMKNNGLVDRLAGNQSEFMKHADKITSMQQLIVAGQYPEAMAIWETLPSSLQQEKYFMLLRIMATMNDDEKYAAAIAAYTQSFPGDPSLELISIDHHFLRQDYDATLKAIDKLDATVQDPYLDCMRANIFLQRKEQPRARQLAEQALARVPHLQQAHFVLLEVTLAQDDHAGTVQCMNEMQNRFNLEFSELESVPEYARFVASPEYAQWLAEQAKE